MEQRKSGPLTSLIISFYNDVKFLELIFAGLEIQTFNRFEVIIADDGSTPHVVKKVAAMVERYPISIKHIWHEDRGFRKTTILNAAIKASSTGYLIFIDGDCIPHPKFIEEHYRNREDRAALTGRRVNLSERITECLTPGMVKKGALQKVLFRQLIIDSIRGKARNVEMGFYIKNMLVRRFLNQSGGLKGCNMSFNKQDLIDVNGFDERYCSPSTGEDTDIEFRMRLNGVRIKKINYMAILYHRYHRKIERGDAVNKPIFDQTKKDKLIYTPYGLKKADPKSDEKL